MHPIVSNQSPLLVSFKIHIFVHFSIMSLWQKKPAVFTLTLFINQFKSDKQLLLIVKGSAINLRRPISRGSASGRTYLLEVFNKWMLQMRNFQS